MVYCPQPLEFPIDSDRTRRDWNGACSLLKMSPYTEDTKESKSSLGASASLIAAFKKLTALFWFLRARARAPANGDGKFR